MAEYSQISKDMYLDARYEWCSMAGSYIIPCKIHGWEDKSERFYISYYDPVMEEVVKKLVPYKYVTGYTWQSLSQKLNLN